MYFSLGQCLDLIPPKLVIIDEEDTNCTEGRSRSDSRFGAINRKPFQMITVLA